VKTKILGSMMLLAALTLPIAAQAQGTVRGAQEGARQGEHDAGPIGAVVGGALGAAAGTVGGTLPIVTTAISASVLCCRKTALPITTSRPNTT
jgi:hypothetical protein